ncbi:hypothetical protein [Pectobacterium brasiliense]|uniref:hypothetical protein n=1 Tax=Pectobacterium brasiliense TaxID=180957 RepID=UPI0005830083|nr:hypothetical protein [Pectobacterium brasiliense]KHT02558.1 hypothetical protein RC92_19485 [Pectobacterium brasiliense]
MKEKHQGNDTEVEKNTIDAKIIIDILIMISVIVLLPVLTYSIYKKYIIFTHPLFIWLANLPFQYFYIASAFGSFFILGWHIYSKGTIKNINDAALTAVTSMAALKIFSENNSSSFNFIDTLLNDPDFFIFSKQIIVICGFAKVCMCFFDFFTGRIKTYRKELENKNQAE